MPNQIFNETFDILLVFISILLFPPVVERTKRCWDFCATIFIIDFVVEYFFIHFPTRVSWWISHIACLFGMIILSEFFCAYFETLPIEAPQRNKKSAAKKAEKQEIATSSDGTS